MFRRAVRFHLASNRHPRLHKTSQRFTPNGLGPNIKGISHPKFGGTSQSGGKERGKPPERASPVIASQRESPGREIGIIWGDFVGKAP